MNSEHIKRIIDNRIPCYFISPHPDDAVLSAGGLMSYLSNHTEVFVVNVFTKPSSQPYSLSARVFLKQCKYDNADDLFKDRINEDRIALESIGIKPFYLGFVDALWRKIENPNFALRMISKILPDIGNVYPLYRYHIVGNKISTKDSQLILRIKDELNTLINTDKPYYVFCPLGIDSHIDHLVVRKSCVNNFNNVIMWSDFPYNVRRKAGGGIDKLVKESFIFNEGKEVKKDIIKLYKSQVGAIFPDNSIALVPEVFYEKLT